MKQGNITTSYIKFINENTINNDIFITYREDKFVYHITSKYNSHIISKEGFKTGKELGIAEKREAVYFADRDVNYGIYARNQEGESYEGDDIGEVPVNIKGLKLLNMNYKDSEGQFSIYKKYRNISVQGDLHNLPYECDGLISYLQDGRIFEVCLSKEIANHILFK